MTDVRVYETGQVLPESLDDEGHPFRFTDHGTEKRPAVVVVRWRDSLTGPGGWVDRAEVEADAKEAFNGPLSAAGFLIADEETHIVLATGYNPHTDEVQGSMMIPRLEVVSMDELQKESGMSDD